MSDRLSEVSKEDEGRDKKPWNGHQKSSRRGPSPERGGQQLAVLPLVLVRGLHAQRPEALLHPEGRLVRGQDALPRRHHGLRGRDELRAEPRTAAHIRQAEGWQLLDFSERF